MIVAFLKDPEPYSKGNCRIPKGVLLSGPPGIGKTLLARAVAGEANVPFFFTTGSEFVEMYVGVGAARIRDLFRIAQRQCPCLVFIDEIDAIGSTRQAGVNMGEQEYHHALSQLLGELDGFKKDDSVVVMGATNRVDILDPALLRSGRFDYIIELQLPDEKDRRAILEVYLHPEDGIFDTEKDMLVERTIGASGADMETLINTARIHAVRTRKTGVIRWEDIDYALGQMHISKGQAFSCL